MNGDTNGRARRMRILAVLTLLVVFVAGGLVGAAVERSRGPGPGRPIHVVRRGPPPLFAEGSPLAERLKLTDSQRDTIEKITARDRAAADSFFRETRRTMRSRFDSTIIALDSVLTPQQRAEWRKIRQEMMERDLRERRLRRGRGPGGPGRGEGGPRGAELLDGPPPPPPDEGAAGPGPRP